MKIGKYNINVDENVKTPKQYSKVWMTRLQLFSMFWISIFLCYEIFVNGAQNAVEIVKLLVISVIGSIVPYMCKSFLETKEDKRLQLERYKYDSNNYFGNNMIINSDDSYTEEVG